jgi:heat shock protein HtpX
MKVSFLLGRALLAVALMVGFYLLALGIAGGLLWIPYAELVYAHRITPKLALICVVAGATILWSVLPRFDKFIAPGPQLERDKFRRLHEELEKVAQATSQAMPAEVYLVPNMNAWVMQRGGLMGFGSKRVMGLGLPLMRVLTRSQLRAVLAHEFGHYFGGDTKIGPWIYKTRNAIGRTLQSLGRSRLQAPFRWYGNMFLRVTHAISRRQEFVADALAARTVGAKPLADGLRTIHKVAPAFDYFWRSEYAPAVQSGFFPPLSEGFGNYVSAKNISEKMDQHLKDQLSRGEANPYDTHPSLKDRLAAVAGLPEGAALSEDLPAVTLLEDVPALERALMIKIAGAETAAKLKPIVWSEIGAQVYVPRWTKLAQLNSVALKSVTAGSLGTLASDLKSFGATLVDFSQRHPKDENAEGLAIAVIGAALSLLLLERRGRLDATLGAEVFITFGAVSVRPFSLLPALKNGQIKAEDWLKQCGELGIAETNLNVIVVPRSDTAEPE